MKRSAALPFLRRLAETPRRPNGFVRRSVAPDCRRRGDPGAHVAASLPGRRAGFPAGRVVGKEYVGAMVAFLTNDLAEVRARGRLVIIRADVQYRPDTRDEQQFATILRRAPSAFCRAIAAEAWHATVRSVPPVSSRAGLGAGQRRPVDRSGLG